MTVVQHFGVSAEGPRDKPYVDLDDSRHVQRVYEQGLRLQGCTQIVHVCELSAALQFTTLKA